MRELNELARWRDGEIGGFYRDRKIGKLEVCGRKGDRAGRAARTKAVAAVVVLLPAGGALLVVCV